MTSVQLEDYFRTAFRSKFLCQMPQRDETHVSPATRLLEKRRETAEVEHALAAQKEEFSMKMEGLAQRRQELDSKVHQLKHSLLKFDRFLKENDSKKARAEKKAVEERLMIKQKNHNIELFRDELIKLEVERDRLKRRLEKYSTFQTYLEQVLDRSEDFSEPREVMTRYDTLVANLKDLEVAGQKNQYTIEREKHRFTRCMEDKGNDMLSYNNKLAHLQTRLDQSQSEAVRWESKWTHIQNTAAKKTLLLGKIKHATHNLYQLIIRHTAHFDEEEEDDNQNDQSRSRSSSAKSSDKKPNHRAIPSVSCSAEVTTMQLERIETFISDLSQICSDIHNKVPSMLVGN